MKCYNSFAYRKNKALRLELLGLKSKRLPGELTGTTTWRAF